jgi:hypothetical protein
VAKDRLGCERMRAELHRQGMEKYRSEEHGSATVAKRTATISIAKDRKGSEKTGRDWRSNGIAQTRTETQRK